MFGVVGVNGIGKLFTGKAGVFEGILTAGATSEGVEIIGVVTEITSVEGGVEEVIVVGITGSGIISVLGGSILTGTTNSGVLGATACCVCIGMVCVGVVVFVGLPLLISILALETTGADVCRLASEVAIVSGLISSAEVFFQANRVGE